MREQQLKEERLMILEAWRDAEANASGNNVSDEDKETRGVGNVSLVEAKLPKKIKMRRTSLSCTRQILLRRYGSASSSTTPIATRRRPRRRAWRATQGEAAPSLLASGM